MRAIAKWTLRFLNDMAAVVGVQISRKGSLARSWDVLLGHLKALGFDPNLVIDVGVATGTHDLYRHFPRAKYVLIEPLAEFESDLRRICLRLDAEYVVAAAGAEPGEIEINVHPKLDGSSVYHEVEGGGTDGEPRTVRVIRIDDIVAGVADGARMLKVDVQGAELQVLQGAEQCLKHTEVVILETSLISTLEGGPELWDVVSYMQARGFVVFDIMGGLERPLDRSLAQVDLVFIPKTHPFRADRRWRPLD